ncbi:MAG: pyridoxamine 5'-phosphate oxidase family protein [Gammaproteobacteria bacterium]|nr:pyridoxamine 5'-phosphate oxidase family protein [Gammaproteobacteria bacterium]MBU1625543.1 pyridoxamine 5'-phosphate oxidase family protein [Gammaproteobacteria bacterium]MBU1980803.1 pyridoxamine 5'-phosphate oxidase family protein [Gammaproteobacteria bacterium]
MITDKTTIQDHGRTARQLLRAHRYGALGTLSKKFDGHPFTSISPYMVDHDGSLLILISGLAEHTKNILNDSRVSLITHNQDDPHIQTQGRVTVVGHAVFQQDRENCGKRYLRYFPEAQTYFDMADFNFYRITPLAIRFIGGFGDIHWVKTEKYLMPRYALQDEEEVLLAELNAQTTGTATQWLGLDCDGYDVKVDGKTERHMFKESVLTAAEARTAIADNTSN